ncbi:protein YgfX [Plesiomonas shigelloides]|uniref:protein YgfX n=1 Tax=Plesiomonas shigelloides TaxID=703 RepID=UPI0015B512FD|nr:protein YgfX [Plesiomonas shigelloides]
MDLLPFNVRPSRRSVQLLSAGYGVLALLACYYLVSETLFSESLSPLWWLLGGALLVALSLEFRHRYRRLRALHGILAWDEGLGISWQGQRWSYRSALFLGRAGVVIWVRRERIDTAADTSKGSSARWPQFVRFSREPIWLLPDMLSNAEWRRLCGKLVQTEQLLAEYR